MLPERSAGNDDRPLRAERATRADAHGARDRLEHRQPRLHTAAAQQDRFHRLGDPMTTNALGAKPRHHTHDQSPGHRHQDTPHPQHVYVRAAEAGAERPGVDEMRDQANQVQERQRQERDDRSHEQRRRRQPENRPRRGEVAQFTLFCAQRPRLRGNDRVSGEPLGMTIARHATTISGDDISSASEAGRIHISAFSPKKIAINRRRTSMKSRPRSGTFRDWPVNHSAAAKSKIVPPLRQARSLL